MATIERLRRRPDFLAATSGRRFHTERMTAQGRLREPGEMRNGAAAQGIHLGFTITKRVGHATERNRIRRRLRRAVEIALADSAAPAIDVVVIARRPSLNAAFETLIDDLRRALAAVTKPPGRRPKDGPKNGNKNGNRHGAENVDAAPGDLARQGAYVPRPTPDSNAPHGSGLTDG